ncbi:hypothetical protein [Radicibacter daui]|uniref:hypothetical protein n=1 Tax=Radicibacter daui TaxID=3064829 RepID=UPI004046F705
MPLISASTGKTPVAPGETAKAAVEAYMASLAPLTEEGAGIASAIFELSTSADPVYSRLVLKTARIQAAADRTTGWLAICRGTLRELAKFMARSLLIRLLRRTSANRDHRAVAGAEAILVGFLADSGGGLVAKDFAGFCETELTGRRIVACGLRLPQVSWRRYLGDRGASVPLEAHFRFVDLAQALRRQILFYRALRSVPALRGSRIDAAFVADFASGHATGSMLYAAAAARLAQYAPDAVVCLPMERHDWEQLLIARLRAAGRQIWAVQNCTFSPNDLNMRVPDNAPRHRRLSPDLLFVIGPHWPAIFADLGVTTPTTALRRHRFSGATYDLKLSKQGRGILYLGSINYAKVSRDLAALSLIRDKIGVWVRLHPTMTEMPLAQSFPRATDLSAHYGYCVYADTTMVFQLRTDQRRLAYLDHPDIPNQDPAGWFDDWPGTTISVSNADEQASRRILLDGFAAMGAGGERPMIDPLGCLASTPKIGQIAVDRSDDDQ